MSERVQELFDSRIRKVVLAYERGTDLKAIAGRVGVSPPTVSKWLTQEGYKRKKKGRVPLAMKARVRDLHLRGWSPERISGLLGLSAGQVASWSDPQANPILGGEKDPLKVKGQRGRKKDKTRGRKRGRPRKPTSKKAEKWPPDRHKCRKHWTPTEESYVLQLMEAGVKPIKIYRRMRASRKRQLKIWRKYGNEGPPPNFPEAPKGPRPGGPILPPAEAKKRRAEAESLEAAADERLLALEEAAAARQQRIAELEAQAVEEERQIKLLEAEQKKLIAQRKDKATRLAQARAALERRELPPGERRRVLPGSFEERELGMTPGELVEPRRPGRPALPKPKHLGEYADNGRYFVVSKEWADLDDATPDELALFADYLTLKKFPARVEARGDQPKAYFESTWPKKVEDRWTRTVENGLTLLEKYRARKKQLKSKKMFSKGIANYLAKAYDAYASPKTTAAQKVIAKEELLDDWARLKKVDRMILIFAMGVADASGAPTSKGIERGRAAKILLQREAEAAAKKLAAKQTATRKREALRSAEDAEVSDILSSGRLALGEGDEES